MKKAIAFVGAVVISVSLLVAIVPARANPVDDTSTEGVHILTVPGTGNQTDPDTGEVINGGVATEINNSNWVVVNDVRWLQFVNGFPVSATGGLIWKGGGLPEPIQTDFLTNEQLPHDDFVIRDINASGEVVGDFLPAGETYRRLFHWTPFGAEFTTFSAGAQSQEATGIDDFGTITGWFRATSTDICGATLCSFLGPITSRDTIADQSFQALDIEEGVVVGNGFTSTGTGDTVPLNGGSGQAINGHDEIAGWQVPEPGRTVAAYWPSRSASPVSIGTLDGDSISMALGINDSGWVVGWSGTSSDPSDERHAFVWRPETGVMQPLGTLAGGSTSAAYDINDNNLVVGEADGRAVIWDLDGGLTITYPELPVIEPIPDQTVTVGEELGLQVTSNAANTVYALVEAPTGATIDATTGLFSWTPTVDQTGAHQVTVQVTDTDTFLFDTESFTITVSGSGGDTTPPQVVIDVPSDGAVFTLGQTINADYTCDDTGGSGIDTCDGDVPAGTPIDTSTIGAHSFSVTATDLAGNTTTLTHDYIVEQATTLLIQVGESILVVDDPVEVRPPLVIAIQEEVAVTDDSAVRPPVTIQISEHVGVNDDTVVRPPVEISISERIAVTDDSTVRPPVTIQISEHVGVTDDTVLLPSVQIQVSENVGVADDPHVEAPVILSGVVWDDFDGDGMFDSPEAPMSGVTVYLDLDDDATHDADEPSKVSGTDGAFSFVVIGLDQVTARQMVPDGYEQSSPDDAYVTDLTSGNVSGLDFGDQPDPDGDLDGDGIHNSVDVFISDAGAVSYDHLVPSQSFTDLVSAGSTFGEIVDPGQQTLTISDAADPAKGVTLTTAPGPEGDTATVELCANPPFQVGIYEDTRADFTCGSLTVDVTSGVITVGTSDGSGVTLEGGSSVHLDDDATNVRIEVLVGTATVTVGDLVIDLGEGEVLENPGQLRDTDDDGLTNSEEILTGTDPDIADTDGDGLVDGIDASWLDAYVQDLPNSEFRARWLSKLLTRIRIAAIDSTVRLGARSSALHQIDRLETRVDGCGATPDGSDWIVDCAAQVGFRELLTVYRRNVATMDLPDPWRSWPR
jgi:probable HAF family extracellular repeat protein